MEEERARRAALKGTKDKSKAQQENRAARQESGTRQQAQSRARSATPRGIFIRRSHHVFDADEYHHR